jgi:hypothetical protein
MSIAAGIGARLASKVKNAAPFKIAHQAFSVRMASAARAHATNHAKHAISRQALERVITLRNTKMIQVSAWA